MNPVRLIKTKKKNRCLSSYFNTLMRWRPIPILAPIFALIFTVSFCDAKALEVSFEEVDIGLPRHSDPHQRSLMSSLNFLEIEKPTKARKKEGSLAPVQPLPDYRLKVMLDPGHGGKDEGAAGRFGLVEKRTVLQLTKKVQRELERSSKHQGYPIEVRLTRHEDHFIPLKERVKMANEWGAYLFVSVHLNSSPVSRVKGFEVYFLSPEASDPETERLALKESDGELPAKKSDVLNILSDVRTTFHMKESAEFAEEMYASLSKRVLPNKRGVRQGPFTVLHGTNMPAVLIEAGYVTHPKESQKLKNEPYLKRLADAISSGIIQFGVRNKKLG